VTCRMCGDKGVFKICYRDGSPTHYAVCLCQAGVRLRDDRNAGRHTGYPVWMAWAAQRGIEMQSVVMVEELLDDAELAQIPRGGTPRPATTIADVMRTRRPRL